MIRKVVIIAAIIILILSLTFVLYLGWQALTEEGGLKPAVAEKPTTIMPPTAAEQPVITETDEDYKKFLKIPAVSPGGTQRAFFEKRAGINYLKIIDIKSNKTILAIEANFEDADLYWQKADEIFISEKPSAETLSSIWSYNLKTEGIKLLAQNEAGLIMRWSANADWALKFHLQGQAPILTLINNQKTLSFKLPFITLPEKCAFGDNKIYCAIPAEIPANLKLPDDYWKKKFYSRDKLIEIRLEPLKIVTLFDENEPKLDAADLLVKDGGLYFTNRYDNKAFILPLDF